MNMTNNYKERASTILLMEETGSGKTTMINAMINYVLGVEFEDDFRFKLVDEQVNQNQAHSQTQGVTAYDLHHQNGFRIPFSLTIVDTPGFGDTRGPERDNEITSAIQEFFNHQNGIQELDAVAFVVKSSDFRLTPSQTYIFNSVLNIFGKDIRENIRFLVTFADGGYPQVLAAIKEAQLPCQMDSSGSPCHHNFNNDGVYTKPSINNDFMLSGKWKMSMENFESFFHELSGIKTTSLQMTTQVLEMRKCLEVQLEFMWDGIDQQLAKMEDLRKTEEIIDQNKEKINNNQNFEITVKVPRKVKDDIENKQSALNCTKCQVTCHYPCSENLWTNFCPAFWEFSPASIPLIALRLGKRMLSNSKEKTDESLQVAPEVDPISVVIETGMNLFSKNRTCKVCPGKCPSSDHVNENHRWVYKQVEEKQTVFEMRKQYEDAKGQQVTAEEKLTSLKEEMMEKLKPKIVQAIGDIARCSNMLKSIALRGNPLTTVEYIQLKIQNEEKEKKRGYEKRIEILQDVLKKANEQATANLNDGEEATSN
uniref:Septin-type G domain-containing protein n=1 Tax=Daphnia galeata TaxID=27404 RepID=A0A8J2WCK3_9CRUS|nr:unnamed protein product [Daphnia galeata]